MRKRTERPEYSSVSDVLRDIAPDDAFLVEFDKHVAERKLIKHLLAMRAVRGLSQHDVAGAIGCTQSRISKLENAKDADVRWGDLEAYARAVGCELAALLTPNDMTPAEQLERHATTIRKHLDDLAQLARSDESLARNAADLFHECFVRFTLAMGDAARHASVGAPASPSIGPQLGGSPGHAGFVSDDHGVQAGPDGAVAATP